MAAPKTVIKKVTPYPIPAELESGGVKKPVEIIKMTPEAMFVRLNNVLINVGAHYQIYFAIPVSKHVVTSQILVMKTFDRSLNPKEHLVERMAELRFEKLADNHRAAIVNFLTAIGQSF